MLVNLCQVHKTKLAYDVLEKRLHLDFCSFFLVTDSPSPFSAILVQQ